MILTSRLEHPSVTRVAEALERRGRAIVKWLGVTPEGVLNLDDVEGFLGEGPASLITVQAVNHETGVIQPVAAAVIRKMAHAAGGGGKERKRKRKKKFFFFFFFFMVFFFFFFFPPPPPPLQYNGWCV